MTFDRDEMKEIGHELSDLGNVLTGVEGQVVGDIAAQSALGLAARILGRVSNRLLDSIEADEKVTR